MTEFKFSG